MMMMLSSISAIELFQLLKHNHEYDAEAVIPCKIT